MWSTRPSSPRTVGDVLRRPLSGTRCGASPPLPALGRPGDESTVFLTEADLGGSRRLPPPPPHFQQQQQQQLQQQQPPPSRLQSAPGPRQTSHASRQASLNTGVSRGGSAKRPVTGAPHARTTVKPPAHTGQRTRRPVDEALFCALRMEGEDTVAAQLRQLGPERLTSDFRSLCSRLSMHHVTAAQFTFLCAAVLNATVAQRDCEVVFAFLRTEQGAGSLDVADLLSRLRTLFVSQDVLCALQLKRMLETNALSECTVSLDELQKAFAGLQRLLESDTVRQQVTLQWRTLQTELTRIHVQYAVLVPTFRVAARRVAPALCAVVQSLHWDGTWGHGDSEDGDADEWGGDGASSRPTTGTYSPETTRAVPFLVSADAPATLLSDVATIYRQRWAERDAATGHLSGGFGAASRRTARRSTWRASNSAVDATNPHFLADVYATGRVVCTRE